MGARRRSAHIPLLASIVATGTLVAACAGSEFGPITNSHASSECVDDSMECINHRGAALRRMVSDRKHAWVRQPATPHAYAAGVRLFAFRSRKRDLNCEELAIGKREADAAPAALRGPGAAGLSPAQVSRGTMLATEVSRELASEMRRRRCRT